MFCASYVTVVFTEQVRIKINFTDLVYLNAKFNPYPLTFWHRRFTFKF